MILDIVLCVIRLFGFNNRNGRGLNPETPYNYTPMADESFLEVMPYKCWITVTEVTIAITLIIIILIF